MDDSMKKFEYRTVKMNKPLVHESILYDMGRDGWEFICFNIYRKNKYGYFKREIREDKNRFLG